MVAPPSKCSKDLSNAVYDDFKRKAIDAAKKRAVAQNVDYDTFKNMVSVAHLRPLQAPNMQVHGSAAPSWSFAADGSRVQAGEAQAVAASAALMSDALPTDPPSTSGAFARDWRRSCPSADHKYRYLQLCGPQGLRTLFKVEIGTDILKDVLGVLSTCWLGHAGAAEESGEGGGALQAALWVAQVLDALSSAGRFTLTLKLLGSTGQQVVASLIAQLQEACDAAGGQAVHVQGSGAALEEVATQEPAQEEQGRAAGGNAEGVGGSQGRAEGPDAPEQPHGSDLQTAQELRTLLTQVRTSYGVK